MARRPRDIVTTPGHVRRRQRLLATAVNRLDSTRAPLAPTHEQIALRAYEIFQKRNSMEGNPLADWLEAERELLIAGATLLETAELPAHEVATGGES